MKTIQTYLSALFLIAIFGCAPNEPKEVETNTLLSDNILLGSWQLISFLPDEGDSSKWQQYPSTILYQKHITPTHFTWFKFDTAKDQLLGIGGGTYTIVDDVYTENIDFFLPVGSSELGQSIPFDVEFEGDTWHHVGYARNMMIDEETGVPVKTDSSKIDERWRRIPTITSTSDMDDIDIEGTWELKTYRDAANAATLEYPSFVKYLKHITPTHFIWVKYNGEGDEVLEAGSGRYSIDKEKYIENIAMMYPAGTETVGTKIDFTYMLSGKTWNHMGYVNTIDRNNKSKPKVDLLIDEVWKRVE
jgi:hypothetical protein